MDFKFSKNEGNIMQFVWVCQKFTLGTPFNPKQGQSKVNDLENG